MAQNGYDIEYDSALNCYVVGYEGDVICLGAETLREAEEEAEVAIADWLDGEAVFSSFEENDDD